jgi:hypothetical protein
MCVICEEKYNDDIQSINCFSCQNVKEIPLIKTLTSLYCSCTNISRIPELPNLQILNCDSTKIAKLPPLRELRELYCSHTLLSELPSLPRLEKLYCQWSPIKYIPSFHTLRVLDCSNCELLIRIDRYPASYKIYNCDWLWVCPKTIESICKAQRIVHRFLKRRDFNRRLVLNKYLYPDIVNIISTYCH